MFIDLETSIVYTKDSKAKIMIDHFTEYINAPEPIRIQIRQALPSGSDQGTVEYEGNRYRWWLINIV